MFCKLDKTACLYLFLCRLSDVFADTDPPEQTAALFQTKNGTSRSAGAQGRDIEAGPGQALNVWNTCTHRHDLDENHGEVSDDV